MRKNVIICKKTKFATKVFALDSLVKITQTSDRKIIPVRAYLCKHCFSWHLTSKPDLFELQMETEKIKLENKHLEEKIVKLEDEISVLNVTVTVLARGQNKKENVQVKADKRVQELSNTIKKQLEQIKELRAFRDSLLAKVNKLTS